MSTAPVLDEAALHQLAEELGGPEALCRFLRRYIVLLEPRLTRLERAVTARCRADWQDAVLSLATSSTMVGAQALAERAAGLQRESASWPTWDAPDGSAASRTGPELGWTAENRADLRRLAAETGRALRVVLAQAAGAVGPG